MEVIGKISKGSKMDQVYLPKKRFGFDTGSYVIIRPLSEKRPIEKFYFYGIKNIEPIKLEIIKEVARIINGNIENYDNLIFTGSFLNKGFYFNDLDFIIVLEPKINTDKVKNEIQRKTGIKAHVINLDNKTLANGLETDPLYQMMLSRCVSTKRFVYKTKNKINYAMLDLHLLKSKTLIDNFDILTGSEKYDLTRNMVAIYLYLHGKKLSNELVDRQIKETFDLKDSAEIRQNILAKKPFLQKYKSIYNKTFNKILKGIKNDSKQKQAH